MGLTVTRLAVKKLAAAQATTKPEPLVAALLGPYGGGKTTVLETLLDE